MKRIATSLFILTALISIYLLATAAFEYLYVDKMMVFNSLDSSTKNIFLLSLLVTGAILSAKVEKINFGKVALLAAILIAAGSVWVFNVQRISHGRLNSRPFIKEIDKDWVIQGDLVNIKGRGFSESWRSGKVFIDDMRLILKYWSPTEIVVEIPVPQSYYNGRLQVEDYGGQKSNRLPIKVVDPTLILTTQ